MAKTILISGASSGFGKGAAFELARRGHKVLAGVRSAAKSESLRAEASAAGADIETILLDIVNPEHRARAFAREIDILVNNAGIMESGPIAEIPMELVRKNFETNVFGTLAMSQGFAPQFVKRGKGKIVTVSSMGGLITVPFAATYTATKHALESLMEGLHTELSGTGVEICVINPGLFATGFNDRGAQTMGAWFNPETTLSRPELLAAATGALESQLDPQVQVDEMVRIIEEEGSKFRNVCPNVIVPWIKAMHANVWDVKGNAPIFLSPVS
ncbi:MAG: SDR family oxidoreductase [Hyphomonadaceae bacterium]